MLALRHLSGPNAGQLYMLKEGRHKLGRASTCQIQIHSQGISKEHFELQVSGTNLVLVDLKSSNGTFVNGTKMNKAVLKAGDRLGVDKFLFDIVKLSESKNLQNFVAGGNHEQGGNSAASAPSEIPTADYNSSFTDKMNRYLEEVLLPGVYQLAEIFEFRTVIFGFSVLFIFLVTFLSLIPMNQITEESVKVESMRRAQTVARALANSNEKAIRTGEISAYSSDLILKDDGITNVYILGKDGSVIAPPEMAGMTVKELAGFVSSIKGQTREMSSLLSGGKIAASTPILVYDPEVQQNVAKAHAVIVYDPGYLKYDDGRAFSLFIQILVIALLLGVVVFYLMFKLIEHPFNLLNIAIDSALREGRDHAVINLKLPILQQVLVSINSLLSRVMHSGPAASSSPHMNDSEWVNLVQLMGFSAILISKDSRVIALNPAFEQLTGVQFQTVGHQTIDYIPDQALKKNCEALMSVASVNPHVIHQDRLEFAGQFFNINCQAITTNGEIHYYILTLTPLAEINGSMTGGAA